MSFSGLLPLTFVIWFLLRLLVYCVYRTDRSMAAAVVDAGDVDEAIASVTSELKVSVTLTDEVETPSDVNKVNDSTVLPETDVSDSAAGDQVSDTTSDVSSSGVDASNVATPSPSAPSSTATPIDDATQGESFLLPLLQGLLLHNKPTTPQGQPQTTTTTQHPPLHHNHQQQQQTTASSNSSSAKPIKTKSTIKPTTNHVEDSGTESGEDLRLLAAGLHNQMNRNDGQHTNDLVAEVTSALARLQKSLQNGNDLVLDATKKNALLALTSRLHVGLLSPEKITAPTPISGSGIKVEQDSEPSSPEREHDVSNLRKPSSGQGRFAKRKNRQNRHTVGVSQEELADARRYIEECVLLENLSNSGTTSTSSLPKDNSSGDVPSVVNRQTTSLHNIPSQLHQIPNGIGGTLKSTELINQVVMRGRKPERDLSSRQSLGIEHLTSPEVELSRRPLSEAISVEHDQNTLAMLHYPNEAPRTTSVKNNYNQLNHSATPLLSNVQRKTTAYNGSTQDNLQRRSFEESDKPSNKYSNRKLKMKRANTIDIPKLFQNEHEDGDDDDKSRQSFGFRRGLQINNTNNISPKTNLPAFQPKTENDHKFLAFIQKQNATVKPNWINPNKSPQPTNSNNWSNTFGSVRSAFENKAQLCDRKPPPANAARTFWKTADVPKPTSNNSLFSSLRHQSSIDAELPKPTPNNTLFSSMRQQSSSIGDLPKATTVPQMPEGRTFNFVETQRRKSDQLMATQQKPVAAPSQPTIVHKNDFSHAPASAFQPIAKSMVIPAFKPIQPESCTIADFQSHANSKPVFTNGNSCIVPKPILPRQPISHEKQNSNQFHSQHIIRPTLVANGTPRSVTSKHLINTFQVNSQPKSPTVGVPWANKASTDKRVLNIASSRFDVKTPPQFSPSPSRSKSMRYGPSAASQFTSAQHADAHQQRRGSLPNDQFDNNLELQRNVQYRPASQDLSQNNQPNYYTQPMSHSMQSTPNLSQTYQPPPPRSIPYQQSYSTPYYSNPGPEYAAQPQRALQYPLPPPPQINYNVPPIGHYQSSYDNAAAPGRHLAISNFSSQQTSHPPSNYYTNHQQSNVTYHPTMGYQPPPQAYQPQIPYQHSSAPIVLRAAESEYVSFPHQIPYTSTDYSQPASVSTFIPYGSVSPATTTTSSMVTPTGDAPLILYNSTPIASYQSDDNSTTRSISMSGSPNPRPMSTDHLSHLDDDNYETDDSAMTDGQEYVAKAQVMRGPVSQTAVTVASKTSRMGDDTKDIQAAKDLQSILKSIKPKKTTAPVVSVKPVMHYQPSVPNSLPLKQPTPQPRYDARAFVAPTIVNTPSTPQSELPPSMSSSYTFGYQPQIPISQSNGHSVFYNNVYQRPLPPSVATHHHTSNGHGLSKSDSWHQICQNSQNNNSTDAPRPIQKTKSTHTLALPKAFEAGIRKSEVSDKQRTVAAYFSGEKSPLSLSRSSSGTQVNNQSSSSTSYANTSASQSTQIRKKSQITRVKTSEKASTSKQLPSSGLSRSHTMPHMVNLSLLDESNVEDAFEDLFNESMS